MAGLREQLGELLAGRACLVGLGNEALGDDGLGMCLARRCQEMAGDAVAVLLAGVSPERHLSWLAQGGFDTVLFLDAVAFGDEPGSVVLLDREAMNARFPQVSTHRLSLGLLARWIEQEGRTSAYLLGVQPGSLQPGTGLSARVAAALDALEALLTQASDRSDQADQADQADRSDRTDRTAPHLLSC